MTATDAPGLTSTGPVQGGAPIAPRLRADVEESTTDTLSATTRAGSHDAVRSDASPSVGPWWRRAAAGSLVLLRALVDLITPFGAVVLTLGVLAWTAGAALRWTEGAVVALTVTGAVAVALAFVIGKLQYAITLDLSDRRVVVGERAFGQLVVTNESARPMLPASMELQVGDGTATFRIGRLRPGGSQEEIFTVPTHRRAVIPVGPVRTIRADPLGMLRRELSWSEPQELFVHPRTAVLADSFIGRMRDLEGRVTPDTSDSDISFHALREYVPGDDLRHIHWLSSARTGSIMVRQFEETRRSRIAVILSTRQDDYASPDEFELAVSVCGSLGLQAIREDGGLSVLATGGRVRGDHRTRLLDDLTRAEMRPARQTMAAFAVQWSRALADVSVVAVVGGSGLSATDLRSLSARLPADARLFAVLASADDAVSDSSVTWGRVGDMDVLTIKTLDDLAGALGRMRD
ncbi:DUF58 domain-containing protein [Isoptericola croceus]|uniref:DUF58 domain-containing protein n=1 Tax=Isoptericola croceus TaxID=3031406 RepID=UPI0023F75430|nr:DUF58 domain-containing protein [Isoptericola croceus]